MLQTINCTRKRGGGQNTRMALIRQGEINFDGERWKREGVRSEVSGKGLSSWEGNGGRNDRAKVLIWWGNRNGAVRKRNQGR